MYHILSRTLQQKTGKGISAGKAFSNTLGIKMKSMAFTISEGFPHDKSIPFIKNIHFWMITALMAVITFLYYIDQTPLINTSSVYTDSLIGVHDFQRSLFFIPVVYAALAFRVRGSLFSSLVFLCVVLPRALLFSPYPNPLLRPLFFVAIAALASLLIATQLNRIEKERQANAELKKAYKKLEENQQQLMQAEKLASLGQMAACITHEVNNPLAVVLNYTQSLIDKIKNNSTSWDNALDYLYKIELETTRSGKLVRNLLEFSNQTTSYLNMVNANEVIERALDLIIYPIKQKHVKVLKELSRSLPGITADFDQLQQVCSNLILNAIEAVPGGGTLTIRTAAIDDCIKIEVMDTGCGIPPENIPKLFLPFFTTKREVKGVGLGLAVAYGIIQRHNGRIEVENKQGEGSTFTIYLPLNQLVNSENSRIPD